MGYLETMEVKHPDGGTMWINVEDYDESKHKKVVVAKKEKPAHTKKTKDKK